MLTLIDIGMRLAGITKVDNPTILHVGAGIGQEVNSYAQWSDKIICIDGDSANIAKIRERHPSVHCIQKVISDKAGIRDWHSLIPPECSSLHAVDPAVAAAYFPTIKQHAVVPVACTALDMLKLPPIDVLVIDVQGHDYAVLSGAVDVLKDCKLVICEVWVRELYKGTKLLPEVEKFMEEHDFKMRHFQPGSTPDFWGDAIFTRRSA